MGRGQLQTKTKISNSSPRSNFIKSHPTSKEFIDTLYKQQKSRVKTLTKLVELARQQNCLPESTVLPDFYNKEFSDDKDLISCFYMNV